MLKTFVTLALFIFSLNVSFGQETTTTPSKGNTPPADTKNETKDPVDQLQMPEGAVPLNPVKTIYLDKADKRLILKTKVAQNNGLLEMFCCIKQSKEHESILSWEGQAKTLHAGLLALGIEPGEPVKFDPKFVPPQGAELEIFVHWKDEKGQSQKARAQDWIRTATRKYFFVKCDSLPPEVKFSEDDNMRYITQDKELLHFGTMKDEARKNYLAMSQDKAYQAKIEELYKLTQSKKMDAKFIFAGSKFVENPENKQMIYLAEGGDLICVANFVSATIDVNINSSAEGEALVFESNTDVIPKLGTDVWIVIQPVKQKTK